MAFIIFLKFFFIRIYGETYSGSLELAYRISYLLFFTPLHTYLVSFFSTRKKNGLLIAVFCVANIAGLFSVFMLRQEGFFIGIPIYLYTLELMTTLPLAVYYFFHIRVAARD